MAFGIAPASPDQALKFYVGPKEIEQLKAKVFEALKPHMDGQAVKLAAVPLCASAS